MLSVGERVRLADGRVGVVTAAAAGTQALRVFAVPSRTVVSVRPCVRTDAPAPAAAAATIEVQASFGSMYRAAAVHVADGIVPARVAVALVGSGSQWTRRHVAAVLASGADRIILLCKDDAVLRGARWTRRTRLGTLLSAPANGAAL
jgi:hypothetical protein